MVNHLRDTHHIDPSDYRAAYGVAWTHGLSGAHLSLRKSANLKARLKAPDFSASWFRDSETHRAKAHQYAKTPHPAPFRQESGKVGLEKAGIVFGRWREKDFLELLRLMKTEDKLLKDIAGKVEGLPPLGAAIKWFYGDPQRHQLLIDTVHQLSIRCQARARMFSPGIIQEIHELRHTGLLQREIADRTGLSVMTVAKLLKKVLPPSDLLP